MMLHTAADPLMIGSLCALLQRNPKFENTLSLFFQLRIQLWGAICALLVSPVLSFYFRVAWSMTVGRPMDGVGIALAMI